MASRPGDFSPQVVTSVTTSRPGGASGRCALGYPPQRTAVHPLTMPRSRLRPVPALLAALFLLSCGGHPPPAPRAPRHRLPRGAHPEDGREPAAHRRGRRPGLRGPDGPLHLAARAGDAQVRPGPGGGGVGGGRAVPHPGQREPVTLKFDRGRVVVGVVVNGRFNLLGERTLPPTLSLAREAPLTPGLHG